MIFINICLCFFLAAALLSVSSASTTTLARQLIRGHSQEATSPALQRKSSQRITAQEGSRILEKFSKKASVQEEDAAVPPVTEPEGTAACARPPLSVLQHVPGPHCLSCTAACARPPLSVLYCGMCPAPIVCPA